MYAKCDSLNLRECAGGENEQVWAVCCKGESDSFTDALGRYACDENWGGENSHTTGGSLDM
jgi:hypothetical protein